MIVSYNTNIITIQMFILLKVKISKVQYYFAISSRGAAITVRDCFIFICKKRIRAFCLTRVVMKFYAARQKISN